MKHAQYYRNIANGIARIAQAVKFGKIALREEPHEFGTMYSKIKGNYIISMPQHGSISKITRRSIFEHNMKVKIRSYKTA